MAKQIRWIALVTCLIVVTVGFIFLFQQNSKLASFEALRDRGILKIVEEKTSPGLTLFNSRYSNLVKLISLEGEVVKSWEVPDPTSEGVHMARLDSVGNLLATIQVRSISKMSPAGKLLWTSKINAHHDVAELPDGNLISFDLNARNFEFNGEQVTAWVDVVKKLSSRDGSILATYPIKHLLEPYLTASMVNKARDGAMRKKYSDIFHCNGLVVVPKTYSAAIREGDILISCRDLNLLLVTDPEFKEERWAFGPEVLEHQHQPTFQDDGTILVFDNRPSRKRSRVIKVDITDKRIVWEYTGSEFTKFFTETMGGVQMLPNKNILVSLGIPGEVLEITPEKELVWRFRNPDYTTPKMPGKREPWQLYRAMRVDAENL